MAHLKPHTSTNYSSSTCSLPSTNATTFPLWTAILISLSGDRTIYKLRIHFQFKYQLSHPVILTIGGTDSKGNVLSNMWWSEQAVGSASEPR